MYLPGNSRMAALTLACIGLCCSTVPAARGSDFDHSGRRSLLQTIADPCQGCLPGSCFSATGCVGCDVEGGWCSDANGKACSRDCTAPIDLSATPMAAAGAAATTAETPATVTPAGATTAPAAATVAAATPAPTAAAVAAATPAATPVTATLAAATLAAATPAVAAGGTGAPLVLHSLCSNKAVLPRNSTAPVFGSGQPGDTVQVLLKSETTTVAQGKAVVAVDGRWVVPLGNLVAGSGFSIEASVPSRNQIVTAADVAVGELWLIAGQSNVGISLTQLRRTGEISFPPFTSRAKGWLDNAEKRPMLHLFKVPMAASATPISALPVATTWAVNDLSVAANYGALGYIAFSNLADELGIHVGVVQADVGGTSIVQWLPTEVLAAIKRPATPRDPPSFNDYNAMIAPLKGAAWSGVVWYQGESDAGLNDVNPLYRFYEPLLTSLLSSWRNTFSQPQLPWEIIQLPIYNSAYRTQFNINGQSGDALNRNYWPYVREAERRVANADPLASLVSAFDLGLTGRIHPPNKFLLAQRLTQSILKQKTGSDKYSATGPTFVSAQYTTSNVVVNFDNVAEGLLIAIKQPFSVNEVDRKPSTFVVECFEVMFGAEWIKATANLAGKSSVAVKWPGRDGETPTNVRYGWYDYAVCNLYNERELPTVPFTSVLNPF